MADVKLSAEQLLALEALEQAGRLEAEHVVRAAQDPTSPLHSLFQWDIEVAAHEHWLMQARSVIRSVEYRITRKEVVVTVPRYVRDPVATPLRPGYVTMSEVEGDPVLAEATVKLEIGRALGYLRRAARIATGLGLFPELDGLVAALASLRDSDVTDGADAAG